MARGHLVAAVLGFGPVFHKAMGSHAAIHHMRDTKIYGACAALQVALGRRGMRITPRGLHPRGCASSIGQDLGELFALYAPPVDVNIKLAKTNVIQIILVSVDTRNHL